MPKISLKTYLAQCVPSFGTGNPERMKKALWKEMVRLALEQPEKATAYQARIHFDIPEAQRSFSPFRPLWCFQRMGQAVVELDGGWRLFIGGEHEDFYDPDFHIYNDVVAVGPRGQIEIYGYPPKVFPPTDFHTATRVGDQIVIVGRLGYAPERLQGQTPVCLLDVRTLAIHPRKTRGAPPSWLFGHQATLVDGGGALLISGGEEMGVWKGRQHFMPNFESYRLDLKTWIWSKLTNNRHWRHYRIQPEDWAKTPWAKMEQLQYLPRELACEVVSLDPFEEIRLRYQGALVVVQPGVKGDAKITIQGRVTNDAARAYVNWVVAFTSQLLGSKFKVEDVSRLRKQIFNRAM